MECPKCKSKDILKRKCLRQVNTNWCVGSNQPQSFKVKEYQCVTCWNEFEKGAE